MEKNALTSLVKEVNRIMSMNIDSKADEKTVIKAITKAAKMFTPDDFGENGFSEKAIKALTEMKIEIPKKKERKVVKTSELKETKKAKTGKKRSEYTRSHALSDAIRKIGKKGMTKKEIVELSEKLFFDKNPEHDQTKGKALYVPEAMFRYAVPSMLLLGVMAEKDGKYFYTPHCNETK